MVFAFPSVFWAGDFGGVGVHSISAPLGEPLGEPLGGGK